MPVDTPHAAYAANASKWKRCRDANGGGDAVKAAGAEYLPVLEGMVASDSAYSAYKTRAVFYPAVGRTVLGLTGLILSKAPTISGVPDLYEGDLDDVTLTGVNLPSFALTLCQELWEVGRTGVLLDMPTAPAASAGKPAPRPYWITYDVEDIINWRTARVNGKTVLTLLVLRENTLKTDPKDEFVTPTECRYRVLRLVNGIYQTSVYIKNPATVKTAQTPEWLEQEKVTPTRRGVPLDFIPFVFLSPAGTDSSIDYPPLLDLVDVNLSHYRTSADHEHGAHYTALPTPWIAGYEVPAGQQMSIGSGVAWVFPNKEAHADMLEFSGAGLGSLADLKEEKRQLMITLGARLLETQKAGVETVGALEMRHAGDRSALVVLADSLGQALTTILRHHLWWCGVDDTTLLEVSVVLNPEIAETLNAKDILSLVALWQAGGMSLKTLYYNLQWGEWTRPGVDYEDEIKDINDEKDAATAAQGAIPKLISTSAAGQPAVVRTAKPHGLKSGQSVVISDHSDPGLNGTHQVNVTGDNSFTVPINLKSNGFGGTFTSAQDPEISN